MNKIFSEKCALSFDDVLIVPQYSYVNKRSYVSTSTKLYGDFRIDIPIISANMDTITGIEMIKKMNELGGLGILHRNMSLTELEDSFKELLKDKDLKFGLSVGSLHRDGPRLDVILDFVSKYTVLDRMVLCVDIANADSDNMVKTLEYIRDKNEYIYIIAGNVCTAKATKRLFRAGADIIKVGVGAGSACTTREETGVGYPQLQAVYNCAKAGPVIADGGIKKPADAVKALAAGARAVMLGGVLAGTSSVPNYEHNKMFGLNSIEYRGSASKEAQDGLGLPINNVEGVSVSIPMKGSNSTEEVVRRFEGGIKSACAYCNAFTLRDLQKNARFIRVSTSSIKENRAHII